MVAILPPSAALLALDPAEPLPELRKKIAAARQRDESTCVADCLAQARFEAEEAAATERIARKLASGLRARRLRAGGVDTLLQHYSLASAGGQALMRLAEAWPRIPDRPTARRLMQDLLSREWPSPHNAHLWLRLAHEGLTLYGRLTGAPKAAGADRPAQNWLGKVIQPLADKTVALALKALGQHFVLGESIEQALAASAPRLRQGYLFSYDMLGEAACTLQDALRYSAAYEHAIDQVGKSAAAHRKTRSGDHPTLAPSVSVKLSALHPRFEALQSERVLTELLPRLITLMRAAARWGIALTIDAEESTRLELTLDLFEALAREPSLAHYQGMGLAVQAYNKSAPFVIDWLTSLARQTDHRFMVRLVKGAYWDAEIKRAQLDGLSHYPVYTQKAYTDTAYLACARKLIDASGILYPQFATQNAHTLAAVYVLGRHKPYEYQCLYGMGEALYDQLIGQSPGNALNDPIGDDFDEELEHRCRIYAPVGTQSTLLAYLVRRLLENGANNAFVHRIVEPKLKLDTLLADPLAKAQAQVQQPAAASALPLPAALYLPQRPNAVGLDLSLEASVEAMADALAESQANTFVAMPLIDGQALRGAHRTLHNPALGREVVGIVIDTPLSALSQAMAAAQAAAPLWAARSVAQRAACLDRAAELLSERRLSFAAVLVREAGKTWSSAIGEVREAIDFLHYYAAEARQVLGQAQARGPIVAISPWNFPLAIFVGQVSAALVAGNPVLAKPAEQTPLVAAAAVALLHEAGVPSNVLQFLPGPGETIGAALVAEPAIAGVLFTGSLEVAQEIAQTLAQRSDSPLFIAETGGINAMIVDSSALPEQAVADIISSAFDSAGQRCSALRVLCVQEDIADHLLALLKGAMDELIVGDPAHPDTDIGPIIDAGAQTALLQAIEELKSTARGWHQTRVTAACAHSSFVPPTLIEVERVQNVSKELFGPILHVVRFAGDELDRLIDAINASGHGLTHGVHSRLESTIARVCKKVRAGNIYVGRNMIGAVVGVQPFGGEGKSGTGPKAGGPLYLRALVRSGATELFPTPAAPSAPPAAGLQRLLGAPLPGLDAAARARLAERITEAHARSLLGRQLELPGPTGERNTLSFEPRGLVACIAPDIETLAELCIAALSAGCSAVLAPNETGHALAAVLGEQAILHPDPAMQEQVSAVLLHSPIDEARALRQRVAQRRGALVRVIHTSQDRLDATALITERCISINTTAWGGNAQLLSAAD